MDASLAQAEIARLEDEIEDLRARQALPLFASLIAHRFERIEYLRGLLADGGVACG